MTKRPSLDTAALRVLMPARISATIVKPHKSYLEIHPSRDAK
jgi:hypothetical protein